MLCTLRLDRGSCVRLCMNGVHHAMPLAEALCPQQSQHDDYGQH